MLAAEEKLKSTSSLLMQKVFEGCVRLFNRSSHSVLDHPVLKIFRKKLIMTNRSHNESKKQVYYLLMRNPKK